MNEWIKEMAFTKITWRGADRRALSNSLRMKAFDTLSSEKTRDKIQTHIKEKDRNTKNQSSIALKFAFCFLCRSKILVPKFWNTWNTLDMTKQRIPHRYIELMIVWQFALIGNTRIAHSMAEKSLQRSQLSGNQNVQYIFMAWKFLKLQ